MITIKNPNYDLQRPDNNQSQSTVNVPSNPLITTAYETMSHPDSLSQYKSGRRYFKMEQTGNKTVIKYDKGKINFSLQFNNIDIFTDSEGDKKSKDKAPALILYMLSCMNNINKFFTDDKGKMSIKFSMQDLVDIGMYKTTRTALVSFEKCWDRIQSIRMNYTLTFKKKNTQTNEFKKEVITVLSDLLTEEDAKELKESLQGIKEHVIQSEKKAPPFFSHYTIAKTSGNAYVTVYIRPTVQVKYLMSEFMYLQPYFFRLSRTAQELLFAISNLARINCDEIKERGYITISNDVIRRRLGLPDASDNYAYRRKQTIENAIEEIEEAHRLYYNNSDFQLLPSDNTGTGVASYFNDGYLKVYFKNEIAAPYITVASEKSKKIAAKKRNVDRIVNKAIAEKKSLEESAENS